MSGKLRFYSDKLHGYKKFYQIVKTIKMVTLAKFRQSMSRTKTRDSTLRFTEKAFDGHALESSSNMTLYLPITSNRGSCGALNTNVYKYLESVSMKDSKILSIGKKGNDALSRFYPKKHCLNIFNDMKNAQHFAFASYVYENALEIPEVNRIEIVFTRFVSASIQRTSSFAFVMYDEWIKNLMNVAASDKEKKHYQYTNALLNLDESVLRDYFDFHATLVILNATCENELSEYAARLIAVESQLTNISQLQTRTLYLYNKTRQGSITASLIEILSAMSAMNQSKSANSNKAKFW